MKDIIAKLSNSPVVPIPPAYKIDGNVDWPAIADYVKYLDNSGAKTIMTTAGTSQYNLLELDDVVFLQKICASNFSGNVIMGLPPLHTNQALAVMSELEKIRQGCFWMPLYPDRYYEDSTIVSYFHTLADAAPQPMFFHGMFMRHGMGGTYDFTSSLINKIAEHDKIIGMKEETTDYAKAYQTLKDVQKQDFVTIVAGGSMRRHLLLNYARSNVTFLSGVGNFYPEIEQCFLDSVRANNVDEASNIVKTYETPLFDVFMKIGWHRALRFGLRSFGPYAHTFDRPPFSQLSQGECDAVNVALEQLRRDYEK